MTTTYKYKSRLITAIGFIATILSFISINEWNSIIPAAYQVWIPTLMAIISYIAVQLSEEKRVVVAEEIAVKKAETEQTGVTLNEEPILNDEYIYSETISLNDDDGC